MPRGRSKRKRMPITYYAQIEADSPEVAKQEALARVLQKILPDTIDEWEVEAELKKKGDPFKGELDIYETQTHFHRVVRNPKSLTREDTSPEVV